MQPLGSFSKISLATPGSDGKSSCLQKKVYSPERWDKLFDNITRFQERILADKERAKKKKEQELKEREREKKLLEEKAQREQKIREKEEEKVLYTTIFKFSVSFIH